MEFKTIPRDLIDPDPTQPRRSMDLEELKALALSIRELGPLQPIIVYYQEGRYVLVDGHRRHKAAEMLGRPSMSAVVLGAPPTPETQLETQLAANCKRVDLKPTEKAAAYQRLKEARNWSNAELAQALHVSRGSVTQTLSYLGLPTEAREKLDAGELAGSTAYAIARAPDAAAKQVLLERASRGDLKRDDALAEVKRSGAGRRKWRVMLRLTGVDVTIVFNAQPELAKIVETGQQIMRVARKALRQGIDVKTLERVLEDQRRAGQKDEQRLLSESVSNVRKGASK